jgi:PIN domain nuclease of toxin-antitoxin system
MNAITARAKADALRIKAQALYAEAKDLRAGPSWGDRACRALAAKLAEAIAADKVFNKADVIAMRLEAEERRRGRAA